MNRARMARILRVLPSSIDRMPYRDYCDLVEVMEADDQLEAIKSRRLLH